MAIYALTKIVKYVSEQNMLQRFWWFVEERPGHLQGMKAKHEIVREVVPWKQKFLPDCCVLSSALGQRGGPYQNVFQYTRKYLPEYKPILMLDGPPVGELMDLNTAELINGLISAT